MRCLTIPLPSHEAIVAALLVCSAIGDDNRAVVMVKGYGGASYDHPDQDYTGICLADYDLTEIVDDPSWFSDYWDCELWVRLPPLRDGGAQ